MHFPSPITALLAIPAVHALVLKDGVGKLPALGWNSWNAFACDVNETKIMTAANEFISLGLKDAGYEYVNIDDCWSVKTRSNITGRILPNPTTFPSGISGLADQIHALGLKIGLYSDAGTETCGGYPASLGREYLDAETFASWGVDYLKYDNCYVPANWTDEYNSCVPDQWQTYGPYVNGSCSVSNTTAPAGYDFGTSNTAIRYKAMTAALLAQNRTILFSLCNWGGEAVQTWGNSTGNSWRITGDITPVWARIAEILNENSFLLNSVNFWGHNDADMLEVGNGNLTLAESRSHFAFWAIAKSPLIIGTALNLLPTDHIAILKNKYLLAFSQDKKFGGPATPYKWGTNPDWTFNATNPAEYWSGASTAGTLVAALNTLDAPAVRSIEWSEVPQLKKQGNSFEVTEVWSGRNLGCVENGIKELVQSHDTIAFLVGKKCSKGWRA